MRGAGAARGGATPAAVSHWWVMLCQDRAGVPANRTVPGKGGPRPLLVGSSSFSADASGWDVARETGLPLDVRS